MSALQSSISTRRCSGDRSTVCTRRIARFGASKNTAVIAAAANSAPYGGPARAVGILYFIVNVGVLLFSLSFRVCVGCKKRGEFIPHTRLLFVVDARDLSSPSERAVFA